MIDTTATSTTASTDREVQRVFGRRGVVRVATVHPQFGPLPRGTIRMLPGAGWSWTDADHVEGGRVTGDYLDAEAALLDATADLDLLDPTYDPAEEEG
jgi:hypothetical protein